MTIWEYKSLLFEFAKNGLLGDRYIDDEEVERELNRLGLQGWELVGVSLLQDGLLAFLKRPAAGERLGIEAGASKVRENPPPAERRASPPPREGRAPISVEYLRSRRNEAEEAPSRARRAERDETPDDDRIGGIRIS